MNVESTKHQDSTNPPLLIASVNTRLFECIYYNHTGRVEQRCEIKARNMEEATTHFKFFYPKKLLWKINAL